MFTGSVQPRPGLPLLRVLLILLGLSGPPAAAVAATLSGQVVDRETSTPLGFATVQLLAPERTRGTVADDQGRFTFRDLEPGRYVVRSAFIGYAADPDTVDLGPDQSLDLTLRMIPEGFQVDPVEVTAPRRREAPRTAESFVNLKGKELAQLPAIGEADPVRSLQLLPGVQSASDISSGLYIRGGGPDQTLILLDGVTIYNPTHAFGLLSTFNADLVDEVTLYKGAYPAEYTGRLGSVLDVRNRAGNRDEVSGAAAISTITSRARAEGPVGNGSWMLGARRTYLDPILNALRKNNSQIPAYFFYDLNGGLDLNAGPRDLIRASAYVGKDDLRFDLADNARINLDWGNQLVSASWTRFLSGSAVGSLQLARSRYESTLDALLFDTPIRIRNEVRDLSLRGDLKLEAGNGHRLRWGVQGNAYEFMYRQEFDNNTGLEFSPTPWEVSAFAEDEWTSGTESTILRGGVRARYFSEGDRVLVEPRAFLNQRLGESLRLKVGGGVYYQLLQLVATEGLAAADFYFPIDGTADPGRSIQGVLGVSWSPDPAYELTAETYFTDLDRLLILDQDAPVQVETPTTDALFLTGGTGYATGLELFLQKRTGRVRGWVGYTLGWTRRRWDEVNDGKRFPPKYDRRHDINVVASMPAGRWTLGSSFVYGTGQAYTSAAARYNLRDPALGEFEDGGYVLPGAKNDARLLPYHRLDLSATYGFRMFNLDSELVIQLFNAYSRRNEWFIEFDPQDAAGEPEIVRQLPVIPSIGLNVTF